MTTLSMREMRAAASAPNRVATTVKNHSPPACPALMGIHEAGFGN
jgi:hypothetical protein